MDSLLTVAVVVAILWSLHRFLGYAEDRGWIYYRKKRGSYGGLHVTTNFLNMYDPSRDTCCRCFRERSEEHTSELQSQSNLVCRLLLEKKKKKKNKIKK